MEDENLELNGGVFSNIKMSELTPNEKLGVFYFAGIKSLKIKIEDDPELLFKLALPHEDNVIFSTLFFLFVIITGNNNEVKNTLLRCKEEEFKEKNIEEKDIDEYIDTFNKRVKDLAAIYLDVNSKVNDDLQFQKELIKSFSTYLLENLNLEKAQEKYDKLETIFLTALKIAFEFRDKKLG